MFSSLVDVAIVVLPSSIITARYLHELENPRDTHPGSNDVKGQDSDIGTE